MSASDKLRGLAQVNISANYVVKARDWYALFLGIIECGGTLPDGSILNDLVRATFCFRQTEGAWKIAHQHTQSP